MPSFTFYASAEAIPPTGARPVFCDIDPETFCVTPETVRAALTPRTKAVIAVHLFGNVAPVAEIEALGVPVLEDAAQALGSRSAAGRPGALGTAATFSFFPSKNLGAFGDGGAITTSDPELAERARALRFHGSRDKQTFEMVGYNSRLDAISGGDPARPAALPGRLVRRPPRRPPTTTRTPGSASWCSCPWPPRRRRPRGISTWSDAEDPDGLAAALSDHGIGARVYYRVPTHRSPGCARTPRTTPLPGTDAAALRHLALPISPVLSVPRRPTRWSTRSRARTSPPPARAEARVSSAAGRVGAGAGLARPCASRRRFRRPPAAAAGPRPPAARHRSPPGRRSGSRAR